MSHSLYTGELGLEPLVPTDRVAAVTRLAEVSFKEALFPLSMILWP